MYTILKKHNFEYNKYDLISDTDNMMRTFC